MTGEGIQKHIPGLGRRSSALASFLRSFDSGDSVKAMRHRINRSRSVDALALGRLCGRLLGDAAVGGCERDRLLLVKTLIALTPGTGPVIRRCLQRRERVYDYEVHFTVFCFLDQVPQLRGASGFAEEVPKLVESYLHDVPRSTAAAAWMAGDMLGDHWRIDQASPVLMRQCADARYAAGRKGAVHGLLQVARRLPGGAPFLPNVIEQLRRVQSGDRSKAVRVCADLALEQLKRERVLGAE